VIALREVVMSERVDQFCNKLRDRLNTIEGRLQSVKTNVDALPAKAEKALRQKLDETQTKLQSQKERVEKARVDLKTRAEQKVAETKEAINEWKAKHETRKLNARAERAEAYAEAAVVNALASIDEAEEAFLDAVAARMDADEVK
jgi:exonuclease VII large subunit